MATTTRVTVDGAALRYLLASSAGPVAQDLLQRGHRVRNAAVSNLSTPSRRGMSGSGRQLPDKAAVDTGALRGSITVEMVTEDGAPAVLIGSNLPYARFIELGTGPIRPHGRFLRWPATNNSGGGGNRRYKSGATAQFVFSRGVPARPARPFLRPALDAAR